MRFPITALLAVALTRLSEAGYVLEDDYSGSNFFNMFNFFTGQDPTHGFVQYVDQGTASNAGLINTNGPAYMGVDHNNVTPNGRPSVRLESKKSYNNGLIILDLAHMPGSICGTWPAFWLYGPNWPNNGEIDVIEGVHENTQNKMTLHTAPGCSIAGGHDMKGSIDSDNCDANVNGNQGCGIMDSSSQSYGTGLNNAGGGVFATEISLSTIKIWRFDRNSVPGDVYGANPNPSGWGSPQAVFSGACDIDRNFNSLNIIFDTTFCGDWAGAVWGGSSCASRAGTCNDFVANNPGAFQDSYWSINSLKVFKSGGDNKDATENVAPANPAPEAVSQPVAAPTNAPSPAETGAAVNSNTPSLLQGSDFGSKQAAPVPAPEPAKPASPDYLQFGNFGSHNSPRDITLTPAKLHRHLRRHMRNARAP